MIMKDEKNKNIPQNSLTDVCTKHKRFCLLLQFKGERLFKIIEMKLYQFCKF